MIKKLIRLIMVVSLCFVTYVMAASSVSVDFTGITEAELGRADGNAFADGGNTIDDFNIGFTGTVDNVTGSINFDPGTDNAIDFSHASLTVADLFDGQLTLKFYDIGNCAGYGCSARIDIGAHGVKATYKPMDLLTIGLGYGLVNNDLLGEEEESLSDYNVGKDGVKLTAINNVDSTNFRANNGDYHQIQLDIGVNLDLLPFTIYLGVALADRTVSKEFLVTDGTSTFTVYTEEDEIALIQGGLSADLLAFILPGALKLDVGAVFGGFASYDILGALEDLNFATLNDGDEFSTDNDLNLVAILYGSVDNLGLEELGLSYYAHYALDTATKHNTMGDVDDDYFKENVLVTVTPNYTLGGFKIALGLGLGVIGEVAAYNYDGYVNKKMEEYEAGKEAISYASTYYKLNIDPSITWTPVSGMSVKLLYELDYILDELYSIDSNESLEDQGINIRHTLGLTTSISFGLASADKE